MGSTTKFSTRCLLFRTALAFLIPQTAIATAGNLRVVSYNIEADIGGFTMARPGLTTVLIGIGNETTNGISARTIDILTLQETTSNIITVDPIVSDLNSNYGAGVYARSLYQATQDGSNGFGNGPNALIYNTTTLQLIASVGIGTPSTSGAPRQPVRYQFRPAGGTSANDFYVYVSHMKSGTASSDMTRRNVEATMLRADASSNLPSTARLIYTGDFNLGSSTESAYVTMTSSTPAAGQAFDPLNMPGNWQNNSAFRAILSESSTNLRYRDDFELVTQNVMSNTNGLSYLSGTYQTFGVNGTTPIHGTVDSSTNTALPGLPNRAAVLTALTTASDHLPIVADYNIPIGTPPTVSISPPTQSICSGGSASFTATATGSPAPSYQWRRGTANLNDAGDISGATSPTLMVSLADSGDAGTNYNCVVTNSAGQATSGNAALSVLSSTPGDVNNDGNIDGADITPFTAVLLSSSGPAPGYCAADVNQDGTVDPQDVQPFITLLLGG